VRNKEITRSVETTPIVKYIERQRLKGFGYLIIKNPMSPATRAYNMKLETTRSIGRPKIKWIGGVTVTLKHLNITAYQATRKCTVKIISDEDLKQAR
jgi:hypothetical protein